MQRLDFSLGFHSCAARHCYGTGEEAGCGSEQTLCTTSKTFCIKLVLILLLCVWCRWCEGVSVTRRLSAAVLLKAT
jgi:hypothetical protein